MQEEAMEHEAWEDLFYRYLLTEKRVAKNTFEAYKRDVAQLLIYLKSQKEDQENISLAQVSPEELRAFVYDLRESKNLTPRSITRKVAVMKSLFGFLHTRYGFVHAAEGLLFPKLEKLLPDYLSEQEISLLLQTVDKSTDQNALRNRVMIYLLYASGMRISELVSLTQSSLHYDTGFIDIAGKGGKARTIPLPQPVMDLLKTYNDTELARFNARHQSLNNQYLFPVVYGGTLRPITRQALWGILRAICHLAGITRPLSPHRLRHSFATHMLKRGLDLRSLQMMLGHERVATVQIYTHVEKSYLRTLYDKKHPRS
jgi:integrase/recombinase XerD